jgi:nucleotide-binding universal stress UspA family protein
MKMLICTIGSKRRKSTLRFAIQVATALSADVTLMGVVGKRQDMEELRQTLELFGQQLTEQGQTVRVMVEVGDAEGLVMRELEAGAYDLIALGRLAKKRSRRSFLSSVAMRIIERAQTSVLVIKGDRSNLARVLICVSGTEYGHLAVWAGAGLACRAGAQATVLHVVDALPSMYTGLGQMEETLAELLQSNSEKSRELKWAAQVVRDECEISEIKLRRGIVADEMLREAKDGEHDLLVLGSSKAGGGLVRVLMGDLNREIVTRAERPVLVVRPMNWQDARGGNGEWDLSSP